MTDKKTDNIVKKVFDRESPERVSALFTHTRKPSKAGRPPRAGKGPSARRLPVAIDFGTSRIKLLQLTQDARGALEVTLMDEEAFTGEAPLNPLLRTKQALEKILSRNPVGPDVLVGLPAKETQTYNFTFPPMSEDELREAVRWKIRQLKPFDLEEDKIRYALLRWEAQGAPAPGAQQRVTVVCVSTDTLSQKSAVLNEVGLVAVSAYVSPVGLVQVRRFRPQPKPEEVMLWLDLGAEESVLIVEKQGIVYFMRNLSVTGRQLTKQVAQSCRKTEGEAEDLKRLHGLEFWTPELQATVVSEEEKAANPPAAVCYALVSALENLVIDIEHSFKYFSYQVTQSQVQRFDRVVLAGGGSNLKRLEDFLRDRLAVPVEKADPFSVLRVQEAVKARRRNLSEDSASFAATAGLAVSPLAPQESVLDFLAGAARASAGAWLQRLKTRPRMAVSLVAFAALLVIAPQVGTALVYKHRADEITRQVRAARAELNRRQSDQLEAAEKEKKLLEKKAALEEKLALFHQAGAGVGNFSDVLTKLASLLPEEIWVTKLSYADRKLILVGSTAKNESVIRFLEDLKKPEEFSDVVFNYTQRDPDSSVFSFEIMMTVT